MTRYAITLDAKSIDYIDEYTISITFPAGHIVTMPKSFIVDITPNISNDINLQKKRYALSKNPTEYKLTLEDVRDIKTEFKKIRDKLLEEYGKASEADNLSLAGLYAKDLSECNYIINCIFVNNKLSHIYERISKQDTAARDSYYDALYKLGFYL